MKKMSLILGAGMMLVLMSGCCSKSGCCSSGSKKSTCASISCCDKGAKKACCPSMQK